MADACAPRAFGRRPRRHSPRHPEVYSCPP
jgi:hypothetical protein